MTSEMERLEALYKALRELDGKVAIPYNLHKSVREVEEWVEEAIHELREREKESC